MMSFSKENNSMDELVERWLSQPDAYPVCILDYGETIVVLLKKERKKLWHTKASMNPSQTFGVLQLHQVLFQPATTSTTSFAA